LDSSFSALIKISIIVNILASRIININKVELHLLRKSSGTSNDEVERLADDETWINILEPELCKDSAAVESLARLLFLIKKEINSGDEGVRRASQILSSGIELIYLYTKAHKAALELYLPSLNGHLKPCDEPLQVINGAIKRGQLKVELEERKALKKG
jgi:hypothetical protein